VDLKLDPAGHTNIVAFEVNLQFEPGVVSINPDDVVMQGMFGDPSTGWNSMVHAIENGNTIRLAYYCLSQSCFYSEGLTTLAVINFEATGSGVSALAFVPHIEVVDINGFNIIKETLDGEIEVKTGAGFSIVPSEQSANPGDQVAVDVVMNPGNNSVTGLVLGLLIPEDKLVNPQVEFKEVFANVTPIQTAEVDVIPSNNATYLKVVLDCGRQCTSPYESNQSVTVATITYDVLPTASGIAPLDYAFDPSWPEPVAHLIYNAIYDVVGYNVLDVDGLSGGVVNIGVGPTPTGVPSPTITPSPTPTDVPTATPTLIPTSTPVPTVTGEPTPTSTPMPTVIPTVTPTPPPGEDVVEIRVTDLNKCTSLLCNLFESAFGYGTYRFIIVATSSQAPEAKLEIAPISDVVFPLGRGLSYVPEDVQYVYSKLLFAQSPITEVTVVSSLGGSDTKPVPYDIEFEEPGVTPTPTPILTATPTVALTPTVTLQPTSTPTLVPTSTPTLIPTSTPTLVPTATLTPIPTNTPTLVPTATSTPIPTNTPTLTPTPTNTPTLIPTPTNTPTLTPTPTSSPTPTNTPTLVPTATLTPVPTNTPTLVPTPTSIQIPTPTPTDVDVPTATPTPVDTVTIPRSLYETLLQTIQDLLAVIDNLINNLF
jgi:hypothetical protein